MHAKIEPLIAVVKEMRNQFTDVKLNGSMIQTDQDKTTKVGYCVSSGGQNSRFDDALNNFEI